MFRFMRYKLTVIALIFFILSSVVFAGPLSYFFQKPLGIFSPLFHQQGVTGYAVETPDKESTIPVGVVVQGGNKVWFDTQKNAYILAFDGDDPVQYELHLDDPFVKEGMIAIYEAQHQFYPLYQAGTGFRKQDGTLLKPQQFIRQADTVLQDHHIEGNSVIFTYDDTFGGTVFHKTYVFHILGRSLLIHVYDPITSDLREGYNYYVGFGSGETKDLVNPDALYLPYLQTPVFVGDNTNGVFTSNYVDFTKSNANDYEEKECGVTDDLYGCPYGVVYALDSEHQVSSLDETLYVTVSSHILDVTQDINSEPSLYKDQLNKRFFFQVHDLAQWAKDHKIKGLRDTYFENTMMLLSKFNLGGLNNLYAIQDKWQKYGFLQGFPTLYPAGDVYGGATIERLLSGTRIRGQLLALAEDYVHMFQSSPDYNEDAIAKDASLALKKGIKNSDGEQSYIIASDKALVYASAQGHAITDNYHVSAGYLPFDTAFDPLVIDQLNLDHQATGSNTYKKMIQQTKQLFKEHRDFMQSPLVGLGDPLGNSLLYTGYLDGVSADLPDGEDTVIIPDYALFVVKPKMTDYGMGLFAYYFDVHKVTPQLLFDSDHFSKYLALTLAFGHAGYWSDVLFDYDTLTAGLLGMSVLKDYYITQALQQEYLSANIKEVGYLVDNKFMRLSRALFNGADFRTSRLMESYDNGLVLYFNFNSENWRLDGNLIPDKVIDAVVATLQDLGGNESDHGEKKYLVLPQYGFVAFNNNTDLLVYSGMYKEHKVDFVRSEDYFFVDTNGVNSTFADKEFRDIYLKKKDGTEVGCVRISLDWSKKIHKPVFDAVGDDGFYIPGDDGTFTTGSCALLSLPPGASCQNGQQDAGEEGIDCGGVCSNSCSSGGGGDNGGGGGGGNRRKTVDFSHSDSFTVLLAEGDEVRVVFDGKRYDFRLQDLTKDAATLRELPHVQDFSFDGKKMYTLDVDTNQRDDFSITLVTIHDRPREAEFTFKLVKITPPTKPVYRPPEEPPVYGETPHETPPALGEVPEQKGNKVYYIITGILVIILLGIGGFFFVKHQKEKKKAKNSFM